MKFALLLLILGLIISCGDENDGGNDPGSSEPTLSIELRGANLAPSSQGLLNKRSGESELLPQSCPSFFKISERADGGTGDLTDAGPISGSCITPISIKGSVVGMWLGGEGGIRLLGGGAGFDGTTKTIIGNEFDITDPTAIGGEDNADEDTFVNENDLLITEFNYLDMKFAVPRAGDTTEYWTYRYAFVSYPFNDILTYLRSEPTPGNVSYTATSTTVGQCIADNWVQTVADAAATAGDATTLGGTIGAYAGDILICRKTSVDSVCSGSDFQWFDTNSDSFTSTRPTDDNTFKFNMLAQHKITCTPEDRGASIDFGGFALPAKLYKSVQFGTKASDPNQAVEYIRIYKAQYAGDTSSYTEGAEMEMFIDFDLKNSILVYDNEGDGAIDMTLDEVTPDYTTYRGLTDAELVPMIWFKPVHVWQNSSCMPWRPGDCNSVKSGVFANVSFKLSGETEFPVYNCETAGDAEIECVGDATASTSAEIE